MLVRVLQLHLQQRILGSQLLNFLHPWIDVLLRSVGDVGCSGRVVQSAHVLLVVVVRRGHACDHETVGVSANGLLKQGSEFGVSIGNVGAAVLLALVIAQAHDDLTQNEEGFVDVDRFLSAEPCGAGLSNSFGPGKVDQLELGYDDVVDVGRVDGFKGEGEDGVRSA